MGNQKQEADLLGASPFDVQREPVDAIYRSSDPCLAAGGERVGTSKATGLFWRLIGGPSLGRSSAEVEYGRGGGRSIFYWL